MKFIPEFVLAFFSKGDEPEAKERTSTLDPCPFCGSSAEILNLSSSHKGTFFAHCPSCLIGTLACDTADEASALWNRRISEKQEPQP